MGVNTIHHSSIFKRKHEISKKVYTRFKSDRAESYLCRIRDECRLSRDGKVTESTGAFMVKEWSVRISGKYLTILQKLSDFKCEDSATRGKRAELRRKMRPLRNGKSVLKREKMKSHLNHRLLPGRTGIFGVGWGRHFPAPKPPPSPLSGGQVKAGLENACSVQSWGGHWAGGGDHLPAESWGFPELETGTRNGLSGRVSTSAGFRADLYLESPGRGFRFGGSRTRDAHPSSFPGRTRRGPAGSGFCAAPGNERRSRCCRSRCRRRKQPPPQLRVWLGASRGRATRAGPFERLHPARSRRPAPPRPAPPEPPASASSRATWGVGVWGGVEWGKTSASAFKGRGYTLRPYLPLARQ